LRRVSDPTPVDVDAAKRALRREMRRVRLDVASAEKSQRISDALIGLVDVSATSLVMVFDAVPGEPDLSAFVTWCAKVGIETLAPDPTPTASVPVDHRSVDLVVVPGVAFTVDGRRLGQGGGWYDRFLADRRPDCQVIGVAFDEQVVDDVPMEPHDVRLRAVVTDVRVIGSTSP
jgi:5-formyltetrahydrofolate cyclo-ligase